MRAARGAIRLGEDSRDAVLEATERLVREILHRNRVETEELVSIFFTATEDITSVFPAEAARRIGLTAVPLLCAREMAVTGSMPAVIRVLVQFNSDRGLEDIEHVYLDGAEALRDDLGVG
ncbi:MAG: chorismate mutase [Actinomycetota bacterium]